jgi:hypothetical protein
MRRIPRSRWTYAAVAVTFGVVVYIVVQAGAALSLYAVGLGVAVLLSAAAGVVAHRSAVGLEPAASRQTEKAREELALVGQLSAGRSGLFSVLEKLEIARSRTLLVVNRITGSGLQTDQVMRFFGRKPDVIIPWSAPFDDAADAGKPLVLTSPTNSGAVAVRDLAAQIAVAAPVVR